MIEGLETKDGRTVSIGDILYYPFRPGPKYVVTHAPKTFAKIGYCYGIERKRGQRSPDTIIQPRFMVHEEEDECLTERSGKQSSD